MPWIVDFKKDFDDENPSNFTGDCSASFVNDQGERTFIYSARIFSIDGISDFVNKARLSKQIFDNYRLSNEDVKKKIEAILNS